MENGGSEAERKQIVGRFAESSCEVCPLHECEWWRTAGLSAPVCSDYREEIRMII